MTLPDDETLLIGLGAPFYRHQGKVHIEAQTISGLRGWQQHFSRVIGFAVCRDRPPPDGWIPLDQAGLPAPQFELAVLPNTYDRRVLRRTRREVRQVLGDLIRRADFRVFSYGGWIGDPGEIAADLARRGGHPHAVWLDRVDSQVVLKNAGSSLRQRLKAQVMSRIIARNETRAIRHAELSLLHGQTVFETLRHRSREPHMAEDIHYDSSDRIDDVALRHKIEGCAAGPLRIVYCGRAVPMKGGQDWVATLALLKRAGVPFMAEWLGDGPDLAPMRQAAEAAGLGPEEVVFHGFVSQREAVRAAYRRGQLLMFCHLSDESPRNLIESLHAATPLVGYRDPYAAALVEEQGAGLLLPRGDTAALARAIGELHHDRARLAQLVEAAGRSARHLTRDEVFAHRAALVRRYLGPGIAAAAGHDDAAV